MPVPLDPLIVGKWNGHSLWMQWTPAEAPEGYCVEIMRPSPKVGADRWVELDAGRTKRSWLVVPMWCEGQAVHARVKANGVDGDPETAMEAEFRKCVCIFGIQAGSQPMVMDRGTMFHAQVDAAACGYALVDPVEIEPGGFARVSVVSLISSGFAQLDHEGHFDLRPGNEVRIWNLEPSTNDLALTGRDYTVLNRLPMDGPISLVRKQQRNPVVR